MLKTDILFIQKNDPLFYEVKLEHNEDRMKFKLFLHEFSNFGSNALHLVPDKCCIAFFGRLSPNFFELLHVPSCLTSLLEDPLHDCPVTFNGSKLRAIWWIDIFLNEIYTLFRKPIESGFGIVSRRLIRPKQWRCTMLFI